MSRPHDTIGFGDAGAATPSSAPRSNVLPFDRKKSSGNHSTPPRPTVAADTTDLLRAVKTTLDREGDAASLIHRLSYCVSHDSELAQRARSYAMELQHYIARLRLLLPAGLCLARTDPASAEPNFIVEGLGPKDAKLVLISFLLRHAETTCQILSSAGDRLNARAAELLWKRAARERQRIVQWIAEHEAGLADHGRVPGRSGQVAFCELRRDPEPAPQDHSAAPEDGLGNARGTCTTVIWKS